MTRKYEEEKHYGVNCDANLSCEQFASLKGLQ